MCDLCKRMPKAQCEQEWFAAVGIVEGKDQADMTVGEWGQVEEFILAKFGSGAVPRSVNSDQSAVNSGESADGDNVPF